MKSLIIDRDKGSRPKRYYNYLNEDRQKYKIDVYTTNPCFEFWLYLHFDEVLNITSDARDSLLNGGASIFALNLLKTMIPDYNKSDLHFEEQFLNNIDKAIENAQSFETDFTRLENNIGSNIGQLIERLRENR